MALPCLPALSQPTYGKPLMTRELVPNPQSPWMASVVHI